MTVFLDCVENGQIDGINRAALDRALQVMQNPQEADRRDRIQACLVELNFHLLQDPARVKSAEFQKLAQEFKVLVAEKEVLKKNYPNLDLANQQVAKGINDQQKQIDQLAQQLLAEKRRTQLYDLDLCQREIDSLESFQTKNALSVAGGGALLTIFTLGVGAVALPFIAAGTAKDFDRIEGHIKSFKEAKRLIQTEGLSLEAAKIRAGAPTFVN